MINAQTALSDSPIEILATPWREVVAGLVGLPCLPDEGEKVHLLLTGGQEVEGRLTWAYRWLLRDGTVRIFQEVTHWRPMEPAN